jgi:PadR family transcriptional regulator PadR
MFRPRMTIATQMVLRALLADPSGEFYGSEIGGAAGLRSGTVHPILARLEAAGWVESRWEDAKAEVVGRPVRRYYRLTATGVEEARAALSRVQQPQPTRLAVRPQPGSL